MRLQQTFLSIAATASLLLGAGLSAQTSWTNLSSSRGELPAPTGSSDQTACLAADFNGDQRQDFIVASRGRGGRIEIWLSTSTSGRFVRALVDNNNVQPEAGGAVHDIDGDGDPDFVLGQDLTGDRIYWWENPSPNFSNTWSRRVIKTGGGKKHHDQVFGDFDGDQKTELVSWNQEAKTLLLFEIPANPRSTSPWPVTTIASGSSRDEGLAAADIDGNGVLDIVGAGRWWGHVGSGKYTEHAIDPSMNFTRVAVAQLVPGGRPEVILTPGDANGNGYWYQWDGTSWQRKLLGYYYHCHSLDVADFDGDGFLDIFTGEMWLGNGAKSELSVHYGNGRGRFQQQVLALGNGIHEGRIADIDGDGDPDIVHKSLNQATPRLDLWRNNRRQLRLDRWRRHLLDGAMAKQAIFIRGGDLDGDGDEDAVAGDSWYANPGNPSSTWTKRSIGGVFRNVAAIYDFDGDGDLDLFGTRGSGATANAEFAWAENNGSGSFTIRTNIQKGTGDFLQGVAVGRFLGSKALQIALSWHQANQGLQVLTVPAKPATQTWSWRRATTTSLDEDVSLGDIDLDGDTDLMLGTVWLESPSGTAHTLGKVSDLRGVGGTPTPDRNSLVDVDRDGDLDVVVSLELGRDIVWFENPLPLLTPVGIWKRHILGNAPGQGFSLDARDFDRDGDIDIVLGEHRNTTTNRVMIFENEVWSRGKTTGWTMHIADSQSTAVADHHDGTQAIDVDHDGDLDILSIGWTNRKVWWFENLGADGTVVATPTITPHGGSFRGFRTVTIATTTAGAALRFTTDGRIPTTNSPPYTGPLTLTATTQLLVRAFKGTDSSEVTEAAFARITGEAGYWRFDAGKGTTAFDDARPIRNGTIRGPIWSQLGRIQTALDFDGRDDRVELGTMDLSGGAMTLSAWIYPDSFSHLGAQDARIISKAADVSEQLHYWMLSALKVGNDTRLRFRLKAGGSTSTLIAGSGHLATRRWTHVAAVYDGKSMLVYLDGEEVGRRLKTGAIDQNPRIAAWIGDQPPLGGRPFDGRIDELRILSRALSAVEVRGLAQDREFDGVRSYGRSTPFCGESLRALTSRAPQAGDPHFAITATDGPVNAPGLALVGLAPHSGFQFGGLNILIDPNRNFDFALIRSDPKGRILLPAPLTNVPAGLTVYLQYFWANTIGSGCPPSPGTLSASDAIEIRVR